jgi:hypothetical protein
VLAIGDSFKRQRAPTSHRVKERALQGESEGGSCAVAAKCKAGAKPKPRGKAKAKSKIGKGQS